MASSRPSVSIVIPTLNGGSDFAALLERILEQKIDRSFEILVIDSGSEDGTMDVALRSGARCLEIAKRDFNHGLTRNLGIRKARGSVVVLTVQDALPIDEHWLQSLVATLDNSSVAGSYSAQVPRPNANPFIRDRLGHWVASSGQRRDQRLDDFDSFERLPPLDKLGLAAFDNVSSAVRREVALRIPFRCRQFGEDLDWGLRVVLAGYTLCFEPASKVIHSHDNSIWYEFKRVYLDHQNLHRLLGVRTIPSWNDLIRSSRHECRRLRQVVASDGQLSDTERSYWSRRVALFVWSQNLAQFLGARSAVGYSRRPIGMRLLETIARRGV